MLHDEGAGQVGGGVVELLNELLGEARALLGVAALHEEVVAADQLAPPYLEELDPHLARVVGECDDVGVVVARGDDPLVLGDRLDGADLVAERGGALELEGVAGRLHLLPQLALDALGIAVQELDDLADHLAVFGAVGGADAGSNATVDVVLEAWTLVDAGDRLGARAVGKELLQQVHGLAHRPGAGERAEVASAVMQDAAREVDLRELLAQVDLDVGIRLVVFEAGVEEGAVLLDEQVLEQQGLLDGFRDDVLEVGDPRHHHLDLPLLACGRLKIGADAAAQTGGFAHVEDAAAAVLHEIDARAGRERLETVGEGQTSPLCGACGGHAVSLPRSAKGATPARSLLGWLGPDVGRDLEHSQRDGDDDGEAANRAHLALQVD